MLILPVILNIALERTTYVTKSFLIALALVKRHISAEEAALASHVEVNSQIQRWGEVEDCESTLSQLIQLVVTKSRSS